MRQGESNRTDCISEQKAYDRVISSNNFLVEYVLARLEKFKILSVVCGNFREKPLIGFNVIAGIRNLRFFLLSLKL